jgi:Vesicle coat protein involved in Golgi to plasma membrane transport
VHGPTSILCSQVLPFSCTQCHPSDAEGSVSPADTPSTSHDTTSTTSSHSHRSNTNSKHHRNFSSTPDNSALSTSFSASIKSNPANASQNIEDHPYFLKVQQSQSQITVDPAERFNSRVGGANNDTCASCSISLPEDVSKKLPTGVSGASDGESGRAKSNSPVLRSREVVHSCGGNHSNSYEDETHDTHMHASLPDSVHSVSVASSSSTSSGTSCHTHILTYLSLHGPPNPADYTLLRQSSIRTLSCELLPRGLSSGPLCFGDPVAGYTVAYVFRLPDPMARGKRRSYALIALAGKDAGRAFRASPIIWRIFQRIAAGIVSAAEKHQEEEKNREEQAFRSSNSVGGRDYTPISSFLTGRALDANGNPRRAGQIRARNLAEIVGNEYIFAELHAQFVTLLQQLGNMFGGAPISDERFVCSTVSSDESPVSQSRRTSVAMSATGNSKFNNNRPGHNRRPSDLTLSSLNISSGPQPIPISPRRPIVA